MRATNAPAAIISTANTNNAVRLRPTRYPRDEGHSRYMGIVGAKGRAAPPRATKRAGSRDGVSYSPMPHRRGVGTAPFFPYRPGAPGGRGARNVLRAVAHEKAGAPKDPARW